LTEEEKELCKFIFETEQGTNETIICERARRTLDHDENIGERITLDDLEDCYGIWDRYSYSKSGNYWYIHCVPDIKHLDGWDDYNEYWLDIKSAKLNVSLIDDSSFEYCINLKNLVLGDNVEKIGAKAFLGCRSIENLQLPESLKLIGAGAFAGDELFCSGAKSITIPSNVGVIGALPYKRGEGATSGIEVPPIHSLTDIQPYAFDSDCTINGWYGTEAHFYAMENNLKFNPMDDLLYGDANGDGAIGIADGVVLQNYILRNGNVGYEADLNKDGRIDSFDMTAMRKKLIEN